MSDTATPEAILEPDLPIVDAHHHLWVIPEAVLAAMEAHTSYAPRALAPVYRRQKRYLFDELMADLNSGHNVRASVFAECHSMYRAGGPEYLQSIGEIEFVNGVAAMAASGLFGDIQACAGIVGGADLRMGDAVEEVLHAHIDAGGGRYRGIRGVDTVYDPDPNILGPGGTPHVLGDARFREGFGHLHPLGLSFDALLLEPQLPDLIDLARAFPETQIILNHAGIPVGVGRHEGKREERFPIWRDNIRTLAQCENVAVKLSGFGVPVGGFASYGAAPPLSSQQLATEWMPYVETCIDAFGADRCMFASNFPVDSSIGSYAVLWNAFKRLAAGASAAEKNALFNRTAAAIYRLDV
jgi:L-fuconolactonase